MYLWKLRARCGNKWSEYSTETFQTLAANGARGADLVMNDREENFGLVITPNPARSKFIVQVRCQQGLPIVLEVLDQQGRMVESRQLNGSAILQVGEGYAAGLYYFRIRQGDQIKEAKGLKID